MKRIVYTLIILLAVAHQDFWWWNDAETMVCGFMPVGLAYHAGVSVAAGLLWALAVRYCWPQGVDLVDATPTDPSGAAGSAHTQLGANE